MNCWCGNAALLPFSDDYWRCPACETLVVRQLPQLGDVQDEERDLYGRNYWFEHQQRDLGSITIVERARSDLAERCVFWLRALLPYLPPPAVALELGSGHGGFVAMLRWLGYDAQGLELSPWIVDFARRAFDIPMLLGRIEEQQIAAHSLDLIVLMDVLEHLPDPVGTIGHAASRLRPGGALFIQTPCYPEGAQYDELVARDDLFLKMLLPNEHIYLFSQSAVRRLLEQVGAPQIVFEPAMAPHDMMLLAAGAPLARRSDAAVAAIYERTPAARLIGALAENNRMITAERAALRAWADDKERATAGMLASSEAALEAKDTFIGSLQAALEAKNTFIESLQAALAEREHALAAASTYGASLQEALATREERLAELERAHADARREYEQYVVSLQAALAAKEEQARSLAATLAERDAELAEAKTYIDSLQQHVESAQTYARSLEAERLPVAQQASSQQAGSL